MSSDNTDAPDPVREYHRCRAAQHSLDARKSLEEGKDQVAALYALHFWLHDQIASAEDPTEGERRMEEMLRRSRNVAQNWTPGRPRPTLHLVVNNTV